MAAGDPPWDRRGHDGELRETNTKTRQRRHVALDPESVAVPVRRDDPRAGRDDGLPKQCASYIAGRSPRRRGLPQIPTDKQPISGAIPARAGTTHARASARPAGTIPARAGTTSTWKAAGMTLADDPRAGGDDCSTWPNGNPDGGRSPRGRGRPGRTGDRAGPDRTIPARAGTTPVQTVRAARTTDDPRAGGDDCASVGAECAWRGRSPRGRGRRTADRVSMTLRADDPRAGGDDRQGGRDDPPAGGRSPRGRGRRGNLGTCRLSTGTIPARAGTT